MFDPSVLLRYNWLIRNSDSVNIISIIVLNCVNFYIVFIKNLKLWQWYIIIFILRKMVFVIRNRDLEGEGGPTVWQRLNWYASFQLLQNHLSNSESQTHPTSVDIFRLVYLTEKFEKLCEIIFLYPYTCIFDWRYKLTILEINGQRNFSLICKFDCIPHQVKENLFKAL